MPVLDTPVHEKSVGGVGPRRCLNRPDYCSSYLVVDRDPETLICKIVEIPNRMSMDCRYDNSLKDPRCEGCFRRGDGEAYKEHVTKKGSP